MDKLTAIKIKYEDGTYSDQIPVSVLGENVEWDSTHTLVDVLGSIDVDITGTIQDQISQLFNEKVSATQLQNYVASQLSEDVSSWLNINVNPVGSAVVVDSSLTISGAAADAKIVGDNISDLKSAFSGVKDVLDLSGVLTLDDADYILQVPTAYDQPVDDPNGTRIRVIFYLKKDSEINAQCSYGKGTVISTFDTLGNAIYAYTGYAIQQIPSDSSYTKDRITLTTSVDCYTTVSLCKEDATAFSSAEKADALASLNITVKLPEEVASKRLDDIDNALSNTFDIITKISDDNYSKTLISYDGYDSNRSLTSVGKDVTTGSVILSFPVTAGAFIKVRLVNRTGGDILYFFQDQKTVPWDSNTHIIGNIHRGSSYTGYLFVPSGATYLVTNADMSNVVSTVANVSYNNLSDNESLYVGEFVQGRLVADGISTSDEYYEYRISTPEVVALPRRISNVHVSINEDYLVAMRCGSEATWLGNNLYWYKSGDTIEIPATANYYAISVTNAVGDTSHMSTKITPSEDIGLTLTMDYKYNVPDHEDAQDILSSARLFFSTSELNTLDKYAVIGHTSDCHGDYRRVDNFMEFCDIVGADCACITGDIVSYKPSNGIKWFNDILLAHNTLPAVCTGNHDVYDSSMTDEGVYDFMFSDVATKIGNATGKTWYVKDITSKKIRVISVNLYQYGGDNRWYTHFTEEQINWFISVLQTTPADYGVIVLSHASQRILDNAMDSSYPTFFQAERLYNNTHNDVNGAPIYDIVDAFISKTTFEQTYTQTGSPSSLGVSADFTNLNSGVEFIAHLTGHFHQDSVCYVPNATNKQLMLNVTCTNAIYGGISYPYLADIQDTGRNKNDSTQDGFNIYVIDRDNKTVKIIRVGSNLTYRMAERKYMEIPYADII